MATIKTSLARGKRGRPRNTEASVRWTLTLPESAAAPWEMLFHDPIIGKVRQNSRNDIIRALLDLTWRSFQEGNSTVNVAHIHQLMREKILLSEDPGEGN